MKHLLALITALSLSLGLSPAQADESTQNVVLINTFTVPADKLDEAIAMWDAAREFLHTQPGYISTKLHQSLSGDAQYQLINVAQWETPEAYQACHRPDARNRKSATYRRRGARPGAVQCDPRLSGTLRNRARVVPYSSSRPCHSCMTQSGRAHARWQRQAIRWSATPPEQRDLPGP
ncbi:antibiotic biosynthesis monooxygenase family protein [Phaeobacter inhibens]|uniref:antibiotic biosynthesis monooxygenase family protein n=1 Tax=Phaeobacter inhibens TaxID=221822 RepID=UPI000CA3C745|nr:antibiotic biosynthesis monooxygenase family protein [Phaeobacter inhibens]AUQ63434.1 antibiotic biosynthesis monooxygenase-like protein [Phaeobacter inhibens]AUQ83340.1 antibiotic biosynthesis monooxygenase-like protein [Phaeobacter inhibens]AUQ91099.1 antibiotic biosynthesis monooxygenase-like protein [Phaeobacter inhibens]